MEGEIGRFRRRHLVPIPVHPLPQPFVVLATDNPIEHEGTYPLPEAQLDRFLLRTRIGYPEPADERAVMRLHAQLGTTPPTVEPVASPGELLAMRSSLDAVEADDDVLGYIVRLVTATRAHPRSRWVPAHAGLLRSCGSPAHTPRWPGGTS